MIIYRYTHVSPLCKYTYLYLAQCISNAIQRDNATRMLNAYAELYYPELEPGGRGLKKYKDSVYRYLGSFWKARAPYPGSATGTTHW